jgi:predicted AAA+ superfamily ATPase
MRTKNYIHRDVEFYGFDDTLIGRHMVFLAGPRQVGKTSLAKNRLANTGCKSLYFNWDDIQTRQAYQADSRFFESPARLTGVEDPWIVFDEIHKRSHWRDILKAAYDIFEDDFRFLITGSARLDLFRRSGDALIGRYNLFHMMPLSIRELLGIPFVPCFLSQEDPSDLAATFERDLNKTIGMEYHEAYENLARFGPFPEPLIRQNQRFNRKWHQDYFSLLVREELRDISRVAELDKIENMIFLLPHRIMAPLSMTNLANELDVAHTTIKSWLQQLQRLYLIFPVTPWSKKITRGLRKSKKWYFLDWYYAPEGPARLENIVATYLYRVCRAMTDMGFGNYRLHYVRTLDKKEIDFLIAKENRPLLAVEVKQTDTTLSRQLRQRNSWFPKHKTLGIQLVDRRDVLQKHADDTYVLSIERFLAMLN